jgi:hypothetical protein
MNSAVIINLDYEQHSSVNCQRIWKEIESRMLQAGFVKNNRLFLTTLDRDTAGKQAKAVVAEVEELMTAQDINVFDSIREFYGLDYEQINDLLAPSSAPIQVDFVDTGTFRAFLNTDPE